MVRLREGKKEEEECGEFLRKARESVFASKPFHGKENPGNMGQPIKNDPKGFGLLLKSSLRMQYRNVISHSLLNQLISGWSSD